jgi:hypothetical protein
VRLPVASLVVFGVGAVVTVSAAAWSVPGPKPPFFPPSEYRVGNFPTSVAIGDLDGDGKPDLAVANTDSNTMSVLLDRDRGRFTRSRFYRTGGGPYRLAIGDLNRDGRADAAVANYESKTVSVLTGRGDGSFEPRVDYPVGSGPWQVAIGDLNGDGKPDLAVANSDPDTVSVLLNNGDGTFEPRVDYPTGSSPLSVAIADLNEDGKPDLATANHFGNSVSVLLNRGDGTFEDTLDYRAGDGPYDLAIGDVNGDGKTDLATADYNNDAGDSDSVLLNKGDGSFPVHVDYGAAGAPDAVELTDLNGDGWLDLVSSAGDDEAITVHLNHRDGTFRGRWDESFGDPMGMATGDLNGDGKPDLVTANGYGSVSVLLNAYGLCNVPAVRGLRIVDAEREIVRANCTRGKIRYAYSTRVRRGHVISDHPRAGTVLPRNSKVSLLVSRGRTTLPNH